MARSSDEILRGLRGLIAEDESVHSGDKIDADAVHHAIQKFADELEEALKREKSQSWHNREMEELILRHEKEIAELKDQTGNAATIYNALKTIHNKVNSLNEECGVDPVEIRDIARAALAAPARQCDVGTAEEQKARMLEYCKSHKNVDGIIICEQCPHHGPNWTWCALRWAQTPYEQKGGIDGVQSAS